MTTINETLAREILDRLIRLESETAANGQRIDDTNKRIDDTNQRITETTNLLLEAIRQVSQQNAEAIRQNAEAIRQMGQQNAEAIRQNAEAIEQVRQENRDTNARLGRLESRVDRLFYAMVGFSVAVVAALVAGQFAG